MKPATPRTDACPHCGAELDRRSTINAGYWFYECWSTYRGGDLCQSPLCRERKARQKAEAEVDRLTGLIREIVTACAERGLPQVAQEIAKQLNNPDNK